MFPTSGTGSDLVIKVYKLLVSREINKEFLFEEKFLGPAYKVHTVIYSIIRF